ncbi:MAG: tyrosine-type recombinase/integrase [Anaerolineales bacterium]|nr:tyrosine-type recombinase/integrase [Anaerolineales bacterium]
MNAITISNNQNLTTVDLSQALADFLRLNIANGDASPKTVASYLTEFRQYTQWCEAEGINPAQATEDDLRAYRSHLVANYAQGTVATKLAAIPQFYDAALWRRLRLDNPAAGLKAPKDRTGWEDAVKFLPLEGFKWLLSLPDNARDRAILALMGWHGLRVEEVVNLNRDDVSLGGDLPTLTVTGKESKTRKVHLIERSAATLSAWLDIRQVQPDEWAVFVSIGNRDKGRRLTTRAVRYMVDGYLDRAGLKADGISCHSLRHSFATWSLAGGRS